MRISVVIPHLNQEELLAECLQSIADGTRHADEVIVVDNGSINLPTQTCQSFPNVTLLVELTPGPGPARNTGVRASTGDVVAFIDADCQADRHWLYAVANGIEKSRFGILGGDVRIRTRSSDSMTILEAYESVYSFRMDKYIKTKGFSGTGNLAVRRDVLTAVGPFSGIEVAEDKDWGNRALLLGYRTEFVPEMLVFHPARRSFRELCRKWDRQIFHEFSVSTSTASGKIRWTAKIILLPFSVFFEIPVIIINNRLNGFWNRAKAIACLASVRSYRSWRMLRYILGLQHADVSQIWNRP